MMNDDDDIFDIGIEIQYTWLTLKAPITTAADDNFFLLFFFIFKRKQV